MAQTKNVTLTLSGGFHNVNPIRVRIPREAYKLLAAGIVELSDTLTKSQQTRLTHHFCGVDGCTCGSYTRAEITANI